MYLSYADNGRIHHYFTGPDFMWDAQPKDPTLLVLEVPDGEQPLLTDKYIVDGQLVTRPTQATTVDKTTLVADGVDMITVSNAPMGTFTATHVKTDDKVSGDINATDTFSTTIPGTYKIKIESFPYLDFETTIEAT